MTFRESYVEGSHKIFSLHVSKMGYRNEPHLVEMTFVRVVIRIGILSFHISIVIRIIASLSAH